MKQENGTVTLTIEEYNQIVDTLKKSFDLQERLCRAYGDKIHILERALKIT